MQLFKTDFPSSFEEFIGNTNSTKILQILVNNYLNHGRPIPHILFYGGPGLGKTTLAEITASEAGCFLHYIIARQLSMEAFNTLITGITSADLVFIDEVHGLDKEILEILYPLLQNQVYKYRTEFGVSDMELPYFPIFTATTDLGDLPEPFLDRFRYHLILDSYTQEEMLAILQLYLEQYGYTLDDDGKIMLVKASQQTPRLLKNYLNATIDIAVGETKELMIHHVQIMMNYLGISENGLNKMQIKYLDFLSKQTNPVGVQALSAALGLPEKDIVHQVEPFLIENGWALRTPRGRIIGGGYE